MSRLADFIFYFPFVICHLSFFISDLPRDSASPNGNRFNRLPMKNDK